MSDVRHIVIRSSIPTKKRFSIESQLCYRNFMSNGLAAILVLLLVGCSSGDDGSQADDLARRCVRMRDHLIELRLDTVENQATQKDARPTADIRAQHRAALQTALGDDFAERCGRTMSIAQIDCVTDAPDREAADACTPR